MTSAHHHFFISISRGGFNNVIRISKPRDLDPWDNELIIVILGYIQYSQNFIIGRDLSTKLPLF